MENEDTLLRLWKLYPKSARKLVSDPLSAGIEALKEADKSNDWQLMNIAVDMLSFIAEDISNVEGKEVKA